ncbi:MAG TPA: cytochrome c oxidase subunit II [Acidimicrobiales bacterium]|nr:cytochrome c oxidase subunit II [Acidimicrobiales bacterium]
MPAGTSRDRHLGGSDGRRRRPRGTRLGLLAAVAGGVLLAGCQVPSFGAYRGSTPQAQDAFKLWQFFFIMGLIVGGIVLALILWSVFRYRRRSEAIPRQTQYHTVVEIFYTVTPIVIVAFLFAFTVITENKVDATPKADVNITVTAFQWGWRFDYPQTGKSVAGETLQDPVMEVPTGQSVAITLVSADVVHGFYVPKFNFSRYALPGVVNHFNFTVLHDGLFRAQCTQLCGLYHSLMFFQVHSVPPAQFQAWVHRIGRGAPSVQALKNQLDAKGPGG